VFVDLRSADSARTFMADRISLPAGIGLAKRRGTVNFGTQIVGRILSINNIEIWAKQGWRFGIYKGHTSPIGGPNPPSELDGHVKFAPRCLYSNIISGFLAGFSEFQINPTFVIMPLKA
jgi:hypothetical protein